MAKCVNCGRVAKEGDTFYVRIDPKSDWWITLFQEAEQNTFCGDCNVKRGGSIVEPAADGEE